MNKIRHVIYFILTQFLVVSAFAATDQMIDKDFYSIESNLKSEFEKSLKRLVGDDFKFAVQLYFKPKAKDTVNKKKAAVDNIETFEAGYMMFPASNLDLQDNQSKKETDETIAKSFSRFEVLLTVPTSVTPEKEKQITDFTKNYFKNYKPTLTVQKFDAEKAVDKDAKNTENELKPKDLIYPAAILFAIMGFILCFYLLGKNFIKGTSILSESLSGLNQIRILDFPKIDPTPQEKKSDKDDFASQPASLFKDQYEKNIHLFKAVCEKNPECILSAFDSSADNKRGALWLLTDLEEKSRLKFKNILGSSYFESYDDSQNAYFDQYSWLQKICEKLILMQIKNQNELNTYFSQEEVQSIYSWNKEEFKDYVTEKKTPAAWRMSLEIFSQKEVSDLFKKFDPENWTEFFKANSVGGDELKALYADFSSAKKVHSLKEAKQGKPVNFIIPEIVSRYNEVDFERAEQLLQMVQQNDAQLYKQVKKQIFTFNEFKQLPSEPLKNFINKLSSDQLFSLMVSIEKEDQTWLNDFINEGNKKIIINDLVQQAERNADPGVKKASMIEAKKLLNDVLKDDTLSLAVTNLERSA